MELFIHNQTYYSKSAVARFWISTDLDLLPHIFIMELSTHNQTSYSKSTVATFQISTGLDMLAAYLHNGALHSQSKSTVATFQISTGLDMLVAHLHKILPSPSSVPCKDSDSIINWHKVLKCFKKLPVHNNWCTLLGVMKMNGPKLTIINNFKERSYCLK